MSNENLVAISSANGLAATQRAYELLLTGSDALDATVAGVTLVENDPKEKTVGYGGLPNENGEVEVDAAVMHGPTARAGGVAALKGIKNAAQLAKLVMEQTDHVLLAGEGALQFAKANGFPEEDLLTETARKIWLYWKQTRSATDDWLSPDIAQLDPAVVRFFKLDTDQVEATTQHVRKVQDAFERPTGTVHCAAIDTGGNISCTTTTSGLAFKIPGRVADSAIIGAGLYVDNAIGSCGSTGRGEATLLSLGSYLAVELMRGGATPAEAGLEVMRRIVQQCEPRLLDADGRPTFGLKLYLLNKQGDHAGVSIKGKADYAVTDVAGTRLEPCVSLLE